MGEKSPPLPPRLKPGGAIQTYFATQRAHFACQPLRADTYQPSARRWFSWPQIVGHAEDTPDLSAASAYVMPNAARRA